MLIISIFIFCIVLFLYLHVHFHMKRSNDLEVYEIEQPSKQRLEEVCDIRQPTTFEYYNEHLLTSLSYHGITTNYRAFDIQVRDVSVSGASAIEKSQKGSDNPNNTVIYIPVTLKIAHEVFQKDTEAKYISENNTDFIDETGLVKVFQLNDEFLRPYMVSTCMYDIMMASQATTTPLRYEVNYRNYFLVTQGRVKILLIPPKDSKYLYPISDYDVFEFRSPVNPWKVQPEYQDDFDKIKTLEVELFQGMIIYIPAYWWYSVQFVVPETSVCSFKYRTHMNSIAILPRTMMNVLQNMNIKRDTLEKRAHIPDHFKPKRSLPVTAVPGTVPGRENDDSSSSSSSQSIQQINSHQYDNQYLPSSLHSKHNPFAVPDIIPEGDKQIISSVLGAETDTAVGPAPASAVEGSGGSGEVTVL
jgi:Cupin-like domain